MIVERSRHDIRHGLGVMLLVLAALWSGPAWAAESVTLRLDWSILGVHAPFYVALERGYYRDAGLDVKISEGKGSGIGVQLVGNGSDTFAFADSAVAAKSVSVGVPVKVVMGILRRSTMAVVFPTDRDLRAPEDLKGKTVTVCAGDSASILFPAYLKSIRLAPGDVRLAAVDCSAKHPFVVQRKADAAVGPGPSSKVLQLNAGATAVAGFDYADAGIVLPSHGIVASLKTIETRPEVVRAFVAATTRGWLETMKDHDAAIATVVRSFPLLKGQETSLKLMLTEHLKYIDTPSTAGKPFGWQSPDDWKKAEQVLVEYLEAKRQPSVDAYFTNDFVAK
jgi:NitT/TauT family transport system substrate-binding protein